MHRDWGEWTTTKSMPSYKRPGRRPDTSVNLCCAAYSRPHTDIRGCAYNASQLLFLHRQLIALGVRGVGDARIALSPRLTLDANQAATYQKCFSTLSATCAMLALHGLGTQLGLDPWRVARPSLPNANAPPQCALYVVCGYKYAQRNFYTCRHLFHARLSTLS